MERLQVNLMIKEQIRYLPPLYRNKWKMRIQLETSYEQFIKHKQDVIIPNDRRYYLREIVDTVRNYHKQAAHQVELGRNYIN